MAIAAAFDTIILGAGAAGLMCALTAGQRGRKVLLLDHADKVGAKILISGGGRCNFTNLDSAPDRLLSRNADFCKSALGRYTQADFISLVERLGGIDTRDLSSKTMEARDVPGLYAIGEALDVTGWLGGYNFQ